MNSKYAFGIKNTTEYFQSLADEFSAFKANDLDEGRALNCAVRAWHISEWVYREFNLQSSQGTIQQYQKKLAQDHDYLSFMHDVANGFKHCTLSRPLSNIEDSALHPGAFSADFNFDFDVSRLVLTLADGSERVFLIEVEKAIEYWRAYLGLT